MNEMEILQTTTDPIEMDMGDPVVEYSPVYPNPVGDPTDDLTKVQIQGNIYQIKDPEVHDWARAEEKPTYTKEEVGLGNVDDTSDMDKPVSTATQTALDNKVDKVAGKGLSEEDFTHTLKDKLDGIEAGAEVNTVNSVAGKTGDITLDKSDVGLGNVDNTSDMNKPVSTATQEALQGLASATQTALNGKVDNSTLNNYYTATQTDNLLNGKVDKDGNKVLSDNNYSDEDKQIVDGVTTALLDKVDKEEGKGLSSNDYTDTEKALVGTIEDKLGKTETAVNSNGLVIATPVTDTAPYIYRPTPVKESFKALMKKIVGASVVWNQLGFGTGTSETNQYARLFKQTQGITVVDTIINHKYYISFVQPKGCAIYQQNRGNIGISYKAYNSPTTDTKIHIITSCTESTSEADISAMISKLETTEEAYNLTNCMFVDLTAMFGTTIADYVYTLETSQSGSGIAWLQSYGFFTEDYYAYKQNKLESGCVSAHKTYDGETLLTNTELSPITLRGLFKLSTDKLTVDGDEYNADGSVTRKYEQRAYQSGDESLANAITDGTNTIVKLETPTTEQTTPFTETEIVGSTEEFIDYEVAQGNRDVAIPVGTETDYYQEMKLPSLPTTSGNHNLIYNPSTGFGWS